MSKYKNWKDERFLDAASQARGNLIDARNWCRMILKKEESNPAYKDIMTVANDFFYEKGQAESFIVQIDKAVEAIEHPERSTPEQRYAARMFIAQCYSWSLLWDKGEPFRSGLYHDNAVPPEAQNDYAYTWPSVIPTITVPEYVTPGIDPFKDNLNG